MKAATAFTLALTVPYGKLSSGFVQLSSGKFRQVHSNRYIRRPSSQQDVEAAPDLMPDSQTLSEVSFHTNLNIAATTWLWLLIESQCCGVPQCISRQDSSSYYTKLCTYVLGILDDGRVCALGACSLCKPTKRYSSGVCFRLHFGLAL